MLTAAAPSDLERALQANDWSQFRRPDGCRPLTDAQAAKARADYAALMETGVRQEIYGPDMSGAIVLLGVVTSFGASAQASQVAA